MPNPEDSKPPRPSRTGRRARPAARLAPKETSIPKLTESVRQLALQNGAHLFGVAPVERFEGAPRGHHPTDLLPDCKSVVVLASRVLDRGLEHWQVMELGGHRDLRRPFHGLHFDDELRRARERRSRGNGPPVVPKDVE